MMFRCSQERHSISSGGVYRDAFAAKHAFRQLASSPNAPKISEPYNFYLEGSCQQCHLFLRRGRRSIIELVSRCMVGLGNSLITLSRLYCPSATSRAWNRSHNGLHWWCCSGEALCFEWNTREHCNGCAMGYVPSVRNTMGRSFQVIH